MLYLLDTNIISYLVREPQGRVALRASTVPEASIAISMIVIGEIACGFEKRRAPKLQRQTSEILQGLDILSLGQDVADHYASIRAALEQKGTPISANDLWIAAHARSLNATLVTANEREFRRVPGLEVENWAAA